MHIHVYTTLNRFDLANNNVPFSGAPGSLIVHRTFDLHPDVTYDVRLIGTPSETRPTKPGAKILGLGIKACAKFAPDDNLNKHRGYCLSYLSHECIVTYDPIQCWEFRTDNEDDDEDEDDAAEFKDVARTKKSNYLFWAIADFEKLLRLRRTLPAYKNHIQPRVLDLLAFLENVTGHVVIDIETRIQDHSLDCIGVASVDQRVAYVVPFYEYDNTLCYHATYIAQIWRAFYKLFTNPKVTIVGHNLSFDLSILCAMYHLPLPHNLYDTMLAMHRQFPMVDKSLSHAISYYTFAPRNHKADIRTNTSASNFRELLAYNADDLSRTAAVMQGQMAYADADPALKDNINIANRLQVLTLIMSMTGIRIDVDKLEPTKDYLRKKVSQLVRCIRILVGIPTFNPNSPQQVGDYLYNKLTYPIIELTKTGAPSTGAKTLYKLQLAQDNPIIPLIIEAKETQKSLSMFEAQLYERPQI